jgi:hypothetical protein
MEDTDPFEVFWSLYPKRKPHANPKAPAKLAFAKALKRGIKAEQLHDGARNYAEYCKDRMTDPVFICMASTFLNQDRYEDFLDYHPSDLKPAKPKPMMASEIIRMMGLGKRG